MLFSIFLQLNVEISNPLSLFFALASFTLKLRSPIQRVPGESLYFIQVCFFLFCFLIEIFNPAGLGANIGHKTKKVDLLSQTISGSFQHFPHTLFTAEDGVVPTTLCGVCDDFFLFELWFSCPFPLSTLCVSFWAHRSADLAPQSSPLLGPRHLGGLL